MPLPPKGAFADLTADDVWSDWQSYFTSMGYTVTGDESTSGDVTTISNMTLSVALPEEEGQFQMVMPEMTLTENGDGTVTIDLPESFPMEITGQAEDENVFAATVTYSHSQLNMVVSGSPDDMTYDYSRPNNLGVKLDSIEVDGESALPNDVFGIDVQASDLSGSSRMQIGENRDISQTFNAATLTYDLNFQDPESGENGLINGQLDQLAFRGRATWSRRILTFRTPKPFTRPGFSFDGIFTYASGSTDLSGTSEGQAFSMNSTSEGGRFAASIDAEKLVYDIDQNSTKLAVTTADLPFPIESRWPRPG